MAKFDEALFEKGLLHCRRGGLNLFVSPAVVSRLDHTVYGSFSPSVSCGSTSYVGLVAVVSSPSAFTWRAVVRRQLDQDAAHPGCGRVWGLRRSEL